LKRGRSLDRYDDGLQKHLTGLRTSLWDEEVLERLEKPVGAAKRCFRVKVVGSNPAGPTIRVDRAQSQKEKIANFLFYLKKKGYRKSTLEGYSDVLKHLARNVDVDDAETVNFHCK